MSKRGYDLFNKKVSKTLKNNIEMCFFLMYISKTSLETWKKLVNRGDNGT